MRPCTRRTPEGGAIVTVEETTIPVGSAETPNQPENLAASGVDVESTAVSGEEPGVSPAVDDASTSDAAVSGASGAEAQPEDSEAAARAAAEAAEKARVEAEELAERRAAQAEVAERRADEAVETIAASAGFVTRAGVYYDLREASNATRAAKEAAKAAEAARAAAAAAEAAVPAAAAAGEGTPADGVAMKPVAAEVPAAPEPPEAEGADQADEPDEGTYVDDVTFSRQVAKLTAAVARQPLQREILYKVLVYCQESRGLQEIEHEVTTYAAFKHAANNPYHFIEVLENAGGLERFELDDEGEVVTPERKEGLTDDEIDDLVASYAFMTTPVGMAVVEQHTPRARIIELLNLVPERKDAYIELLEFCSEEPRTYNEVSQLFKGRDVLVRLVDGEPQTMQPSVFIDKLEAAGGIEWRDGWVLTEEGKSYLAELHEL